MNDLDRLRERIAQGWWKFDAGGSRTLVGSPPHLDLYVAVRALDSRFPVHADVSAIFDSLARRIVNLFPRRVHTEIETTYDARIVVIEFNDHPDTTHADVLKVLAVAEWSDSTS